jgi:cytochrome c553
MKLSTAVIIGCAAWLNTSALCAADITPELHEAAVRVAVTTCANCHGAQGRSANPKFPRLAAQHATYLVTQMKNFKSQTRGDPDALGYMWGMAAPLSDELIGALADYYSTQTAAAGESSDPALVARGRDIYENGVASEGIPPCASCHGPNAAGTDDFPRLAGQHAQYLLKQLRSFQNNMRDVAIMHGVAAGLKTGEMDAVASYLQSLGN